MVNVMMKKGISRQNQALIQTFIPCLISPLRKADISIVPINIPIAR